MKRPLTKADLNKHSRAKAKDRLGLNLSKDLRRNIIRDIQHPPANGSLLVKFISRAASSIICKFCRARIWQREGVWCHQIAKGHQAEPKDVGEDRHSKNRSVWEVTWE